MIVSCPQCQKKLEVEAGSVGRQVQCPGCQKLFAVSASPGVGGSSTPSYPPGPSRRPASATAVPGLTGTGVGKLLLVVGLILVLFARGLDSLSARGVARAHARVSQAEAQEESDKEIRDLQEDARSAAYSNTMNAYWFEWLFVLGSVLLVGGLVWVGFAGSGAERIICLIMIAIVTFSIYIGGTAWIGSIANNIAGVTSSMRGVF